MMLSFRNVSKTYSLGQENLVAAVRDVSLTIEPGEFIVITGRSGSGKTTLLNLAAGLTRPTAGEVWLEHANVWELSDQAQSALRNQKIGFIFQFPSLLPALTVLDNVALPTIFGRKPANDQAYAHATELLGMVGLADKLDAYPRQLSAGQQQRVVIARALINQPQLLLADEATSHLDEQTEQEIMALLWGIHANAGVTILMVAHSTDLIRYGTRALKMANGMIVN